MLATDEIRGNGDVLALVVADSRQNAIDAAGKIKIEAEELPAIFDPEEAMKPGAILVHPEKKTNIVCHHKIRRGNLAKGFADADLILDRTFHTQRIEHAYMEPEACCVRASR